MRKIIYAPLFVFAGAFMVVTSAFATHRCSSGMMTYVWPPHVCILDVPLPMPIMDLSNEPSDSPYGMPYAFGDPQNGLKYMPIDMPVDSGQGRMGDVNRDTPSTGFWPVSGCPYIPKPDPIGPGCTNEPVYDKNNDHCLLYYKPQCSNGCPVEIPIVLTPEEESVHCSIKPNFYTISTPTGNKSCPQSVKSCPMPPRFNPFEPSICEDAPPPPGCHVAIRGFDGCVKYEQCPDDSLSSSNQFSVGSQPLSGGLLERIGNNFLNFLAPPQSVYPSPSSKNDRNIFSPPVENTIRVINGVPYGTMSDGDRYSLDPSDPLYPLDITNGGDDDESSSLEPWRPMSPEEAKRAYEEKYKNIINKPLQSQPSRVSGYASGGGGKILNRVEKTVDASGNVTRKEISLNKLYELMFSAFDTFETFLEKIKGVPLGNLNLPF